MAHPPVLEEHHNFRHTEAYNHHILSKLSEPLH